MTWFKPFAKNKQGLRYARYYDGLNGLTQRFPTHYYTI